MHSTTENLLLESTELFCVALCMIYKIHIFSIHFQQGKNHFKLKMLIALKMHFMQFLYLSYCKQNVCLPL